jgi:hypothetical protein
MIHCTDLIRALEQYLRGYGDRTSIDRLLGMARRNLEDPRVFAWQRDRLAVLVNEVQASVDSAQAPGAMVLPSQGNQARPGL